MSGSITEYGGFLVLVINLISNALWYTGYRDVHIDMIPFSRNNVVSLSFSNILLIVCTITYSSIHFVRKKYQYAFKHS